MLSLSIKDQNKTLIWLSDICLTVGLLSAFAFHCFNWKVVIWLYSNSVNICSGLPVKDMCMTITCKTMFSTNYSVRSVVLWYYCPSTGNCLRSDFIMIWCKDLRQNAIGPTVLALIAHNNEIMYLFGYKDAVLLVTVILFFSSLILSAILVPTCILAI